MKRLLPIRLYALLLSLIFCISSVIVPCGISFASTESEEPAGDVPGFKILANGNKETLDTAFSGVTVTDESVYPGSDYSAKLSLTKAMVATLPMNIDWKDYSYFKIRWRADMPGQILNIVFSNTENIAGQKYLRKRGGPSLDWSDYTVSVSDFNDYYGTSENGKSIGFIQISGSGWNNTDYDSSCSIYIDSIYLVSSDYGKEMAIPVSSIDGMSTLNPDIAGDRKIHFTFQDTLYATDYSELVSVTEDDEELSKELYTVSLDDKTLTFQFDELLEDNSSYTITLPAPDKIYSKRGKVLKEEVKKTFSVSYGKGFVGFDSNVMVPGSTLTANFYAGTSAPYGFYVSSYDNEGFEISASSVVSDDDTGVTETIIPDDAKSVKAYITDKDENLLYYAVLDFEGKSNVSLTVDDALITQAKQDIGTVDGVKASGTGTAFNAPVLAKVISPDGKIIAMEPISTDENGRFSYDFPFGDDITSGTYTVSFGLGNSRASYELAYVSPAEAEEFVKVANETDVKKLSKWLTEKRNMIPQYFSDEKTVEDGAIILCEKAPYSTYDELYEVLSSIPVVVAELNDLLWSNMAEYIIENHDFILEDDCEEYADFVKLTDKKRNLICKEIVKENPFDGINDFRDAFKDAVEEYLDDEKESSKKTSGGSGGGSVTSTTTVSYPVQTPTGNTGSFDTDTQIPVAQNSFDDLAGYEWAKDSIELLCNKGVVSFPSDKCFRPGDNITREELVKLIVVSFAKDGDLSGHVFADSSADAWYTQYLDKAFTAGIVLGRPDGSFGIGESITREDMAVMIYRALEVCGEDLSEGDVSVFSDNSAVSEYAKEAIGAMVSDGIISGMGDGSFSPKSCATRAQAATVIARVINKLQGGA